MWKVYNVESGKILKGGFENEDLAKEWYDEKIGDRADLFLIDEMDQDEVDEWNEKVANEEVEPPEEVVEEELVVEEDDFDDDYDSDDSDDDYMSTILEDGEEDDD